MNLPSIHQSDAVLTAVNDQQADDRAVLTGHDTGSMLISSELHAGVNPPGIAATSDRFLFAASGRGTVGLESGCGQTQNRIGTGSNEQTIHRLRRG